MNPVHEWENNGTLYHGNCLEILKGMPDNSVDSVITDPPAGIRFMNLEFDSFKESKTSTGWDAFRRDSYGESDRGNFIAWMTEVFTEVTRVLKPGGHALVWALPRTSHWTGMALEDSGLEVRDTIHHAFSTGFPKSLNVSKAIDASSATDEAKQWDGYGTSLKPAHEIWWLVRKPLEGTVAANVLKWGTGALNIDGTRIEFSERDDARIGQGYQHNAKAGLDIGNKDNSFGQPTQLYKSTGRFPANFIISHSEDCLQISTKTLNGDQRQGGLGKRPGGFYNVGSDSGLPGPEGPIYGNEEVPVWQCSDGCPVKELDRQSGGASRFFYCAKPSKKEKTINGTVYNNHPTVKSVKLMSYLVTLINPPGGIVLDPFAGSGTTLVACAQAGIPFLGIEQSDEYIPIIIGRLDSVLFPQGIKTVRTEGSFFSD